MRPLGTSQEVTIRKAKLSDLNELSIIFEETIRFTCNNDYTSQQIDVWVSSITNQEKWKNKILNQFFLIAELDNKIVGFGSLDKNYLDLLYVSHKFLRTGIANKLYQSLKEEALKKGEMKLESDVSITAYPFFKKMGFEIIKKNEFELNGVHISNYRMALDMRKKTANNNI